MLIPAKTVTTETRSTMTIVPQPRFEGGNGFCGDGVLDPALEECDDGNNENGDDCSADCVIEQPAEDCVDGDEKTADDGCNTCTCNNGAWGCTEVACDPICRIAVFRGTRSDDGNTQDGDGCSATVSSKPPTASAATAS